MAHLRELLSWVTSHIVRVVGFLGALAALLVAVMTILCTMHIIICRTPSHPEIKSISPTEVTPGQEISVSGDHLDLVEEVQLRIGLVVERLFMLPLSETGMLLAVPIGVDKAEYIVEIREKESKNSLRLSTCWKSLDQIAKQFPQRK